MKLFLVIDHSGSMCENGKQWIVKTLLSQIRQYIHFNRLAYEIELYLLSDTVQSVSWGIQEELPSEVLFPHGKFNGQVLTDAFPKVEGKMILLTDGAVLHDQFTLLRRWVRDGNQQKIVFLVVGGRGESVCFQKGYYSAEEACVLCDEFLNENVYVQSQV